MLKKCLSVVDLDLVIECVGGRDDSSLRVNVKLIDRRPPGQRELVERCPFAVRRRHDAYLCAWRLVLLDVKYVDWQFEAWSLVVDVNHVCLLYTSPSPRD